MKQKTSPSIGVCVLAGGLSSRMGRDKARLRLGKRTMLSQIRATVKALGLPLRIIRHDLIKGYGPLGGIYTALKTSRADAELFLACDMPFVSDTLLTGLLAKFRTYQRPVFVISDKGAGFAFVLPRTSLERVEQQLAKKQFSVQALARNLRARVFKPPGKEMEELFNINTPEDLTKARRRWKRTRVIKL